MRFEPMWTDRLLLRPVRLEDAVSLAARRSEPAVARFQNWTLPYPIEKAEELVAELVTMDGPQNEQWWMAVIVDSTTDEPIGDLAVHMTWGMRSAEIGYTLGSRHWGKGYATEAAEALIEFLFSHQSLTRISASLHPDNVASAMVLERLGFLFEGHTRLSFWVGTDNSDDWLYGMTRADWRSWKARSRHKPAAIELLPVDHMNMRDVAALRTHKS
ncbi:MAG: GNAT family N-acetyltransferase, partial [Acidimicrobiia bacterium]|nr:GNAT family N-acetyltransferase [Acidimicrobiia bacterium]